MKIVAVTKISCLFATVMLTSKEGREGGAKWKIVWF